MVGKTKSSNLQSYFRTKITDAKNPNYNTSSHLFASMRKHGFEHFHVYPLIESCTNNEALCAWEQVLISLLNTQNSDTGYNICKGGEGFSGPHTSEWKRDQKIRLKKMGHRPSLEATLKSLVVRKEIQARTGRYPGAPLGDLLGKNINGITILQRLENSKEGDARWLCRCHCGNTFPVEGASLRSNHTRSCGCLKNSQNRINLNRKGKIVSEVSRKKMSESRKRFLTRSEGISRRT